MQDVMLDTETFGTKPGSVIRSVGAVFFDLRGGMGSEYYRNIDHQSCLDAGLTIDPDTAAWWEKQGEEAKASLLADPRPLKNVVLELASWMLTKGGKDVRVWCQGANFDAPLWEAASKAIGKSAPWKFYNVRDTRTLYDLYGFDPRCVNRQGTYHNALDDAKHQVRCIHTAVERFSLSTL